MRVLVIGDPHFQKKMLPEMELACADILEICRTERPDFCVCLGDTLDTHEKIHLQCLDSAVDFFKSIALICPLYVLIGNHDRMNNQDFLTKVHPFECLETYPGIVIIWDTLRLTIGGYDLIFVPYVPNGRFLEALERVEFSSKPEPHLIFAHQEFKGCRMGPICSEKGDIWSKQSCPIVSGHIHDEQSLGNIFYAGTFIQQNYGESPDKGVHLLTLTETGYERQKFSLPSVPVYRTVVVREEDMSSLGEIEMDKYTKIVFETDNAKAIKMDSKIQAFVKKAGKVDYRKSREARAEIRGETFEDLVLQQLDPYTQMIFMTSVL